MLPKQYNNRSIALLAFVIIISAFTGYRIGLSNQSILMSLSQYSTNNNHYTTSTSSSTATLHKLTQIATTARSNSINESELPYSCGVLLYFHSKFVWMKLSALGRIFLHCICPQWVVRTSHTIHTSSTSLQYHARVVWRWTIICWIIPHSVMARQSTLPFGVVRRHQRH